MGLADWATKKTIKVQLGRLNLAYALGKDGGPAARLAQQKIIDSVLGALADLFVTDNELLTVELINYFGQDIAKDVYQKIKKISSDKNGYGPTSGASLESILSE